MPNMSYCRFTNTLADLRECEEHFEDDGLSEEEAINRDKLLKLCHRIVECYYEE
jgi:hypothetical protein